MAEGVDEVVTMDDANQQRLRKSMKWPSDEGLQGSIVSSKPKRTAKQVSATKIPKMYVPEAHGPPLEGVGMCKQ